MRLCVAVRNLITVLLLLSFAVPCLSDVRMGALHVAPYAFDTWGRLKAHPSYTKVGCPEKENFGTVIFLAGQSNAANFAAIAPEAMPALSPTRMTISLFQHGNCYKSSQIAPALGGTGLGNHLWNWLEFSSSIGEAARPAILSVFAIHGTKIARFSDPTSLLPAMLREFNQLNSRYPVTDIFWLQGESDFLENTTAEAYFADLRKTIEHFYAQGFTGTFWLSATTRCRSNMRLWFKNNDIASIQKLAATRLQKIGRVRFAIDIDEDFPDSARVDGCHFNGSGLRALGKRIGDVLSQERQ